jgi:tRNA threonylcarbamoyladenosine modification (KEOPS) complex  Pcc1 subunit
MDVGARVLPPLELEARSSPPGGNIEIIFDDVKGTLDLKMFSDDMSTLRAMLNSYLGLVSTAVKAAWDGC